MIDLPLIQLGGWSISARLQQSPGGGGTAQHRSSCQVNSGAISSRAQIRSTPTSHGRECRSSSSSRPAGRVPFRLYSQLVQPYFQ